MGAETLQLTHVCFRIHLQIYVLLRTAVRNLDEADVAAQLNSRPTLTVGKHSSLDR